ncbi:Flp family type IVb pilin [Sphingobium vermicomposti]|uniref:Pilus assembly protein Flp/PilA n=1 Tax=Sphingobium vermicomposti TaxID=529005 RepID=A0A846M666_9SPHN|nr:Flp family type IVb pilin [Sphingobium vermicomposti]NIJ16121.1 pilus assembly protein Flp/PilA [Sphingobium vermicomposti]
MGGLIEIISKMSLLRCERGATAIEYGLILALITLAIISAVTNVADKTINMWGNVATEVINN